VAIVSVMALSLTSAIRPKMPQESLLAARCPNTNWPSLQPTDPAYPYAADLLRALNEGGIAVLCVAPSVMTGMFEAEEGAALYKTNHGDFEALFLPPSNTFDRLRIAERREEGRYLYSFDGEPKPMSASPFDATQPLYFARNANRLIVAYSSALVSEIRDILTRR
jgi:hypothetical protein